MRKQSFTEELKEHLGALEAKLEAEIGENIKLLGDLRYYEEMRIPELERQLAEARAEIERLRARNAILDNAIAEMIEEQASLCVEEQSITELVAAKDKLVEQMRDALIQAKDNFETMDKIMSTRCAPIRIARAAYNTGLSYLDDAIEAALAAERTEK